MLSASSLPCVDPISPAGRSQRVESVRNTGTDGKHDITLHSAMHSAGRGQGQSASQQAHAQVSVDAAHLDDSLRFTAPCLCGCQRGAPASSVAGTQLSIVALPSFPGLPIQPVLESRSLISLPQKTMRDPVPDWIPI